MKDDFGIKNFSSKDIITLKYRPQKFSEFIGQPQVTIPLINSIKNGKIHHAYLFYGPRGVGKTSAARILAKMLNCLDFNNNEPCLKCENCIEISNGISSDVIEIDGASNRGIDEIRNLQSNLIYAPTKSRFKIYIIDEVHMLTKEAFNALLKTLEEPPEHIIFIFATTEIHKVLPTIRSRCQQYQFTLFKITDISSQIIKILKEYDVKYDNEVPALIAKYGNGSMRDALSILSQILSYNDREIKIETVYNLLGIYSFDYIKKIFENIASRDLSSIFTICSEIYYQGISLDNISSQLLEFIRLLTLLKNGVEDINILNQAFTDFEKLTSLSEAFTTKKLILMAKKLIEFQKSFSVWSNPFYAFENLLVSFIYDDFYVTATEYLNKIQESIKYLEKSFNIIGSKPDEIILKKTFTNSSQIINKKDLENDIMNKKGLNITEKTENIHLINNEVYDKDINKIIDKKENSEEEDLEKIKKDEEKKLISENLLQILDQTDTKNFSNINIEKTAQKEEDEIKNNYEEKELNEDRRKDKLDMNNFANNLKKSIEKEIEKENIPEPFKKVLKYANGIYRNKEKDDV
ncbi:MAG: DNA polymerase III subunit gamma/tau [Exilispira sp.]